MQMALEYQADELADSVTDPSLKEKLVDGAQLQMKEPRHKRALQGASTPHR